MALDACADYYGGTRKRRLALLMRLWVIEEMTQLIRPLQVTQPQFYSPDDENFFVLFLSLTFCFSSDDSVTFDSPFFYG